MTDIPTMNYHWGRTRVKICGLTRACDAKAAAELGADAIGLVFFPSSPRAVTSQDAKEIVAALPPFVTVVGLFVNAAPPDVRAVLAQVSIDLLQFHGDETPAYCASFGRPYIKAIQMRPDVDLGHAQSCFSDAQALLLDAYHTDARGGTGRTFDWTRAASESRRPLILAGGLSSENVRSALEIAKPYGVDVSSGAESDKGIKDSKKMAQFLNEVYEFDYRQRAR
jgi:phosphoribosylanthranilate isomerase